MTNYWTEQEIQLLKLNYLNLTHTDLGEILGRSSAAVRNKCYDLKLRKLSFGRTEEEIEKIREHYVQCGEEGVDLESFVKKLNLTPCQVCEVARELGLTNQFRKKTYDWEESSRIGKARIKKYGHPQGMLGKTHSDENKRKTSVGTKAMWADPTSIFNSVEFKQRQSDEMIRRHKEGILGNNNTYSRCKRGKREDLNNVFFRSSWEANYARYLNWLISLKEIQKWEYEVDRFEFHKIKRGTRTYSPDFKVYLNDGSIEYHEVKGWLDLKSKTRLKRMKKYYPEVKIVYVGEKEYKEIAKAVKPFIENWE